MKQSVGQASDPVGTQLLGSKSHDCETANGNNRVTKGVLRARTSVLPVEQRSDRASQATTGAQPPCYYPEWANHWSLRHQVWGHDNATGQNRGRRNVREPLQSEDITPTQRLPQAECRSRAGHFFSGRPSLSLILPVAIRTTSTSDHTPIPPHVRSLRTPRPV